MKPLFYQQFNLDSEPLLAFFGDQARSTLLQKLANEAVQRQLRVLVVSLHPARYPIEGKVLVGDEVLFMLNLITDAKPSVTYLAYQLSDDLLLPFAADQLDLLSRNLPPDTRLLFDINSTEKTDRESLTFLDRYTSVCHINFNLIRDDLLHMYHRTQLNASGELTDSITDQMKTLIDKKCPYLKYLPGQSTRVLFFGQVKNLLDQNMLIPMARILKPVYEGRVLYGNINTSYLREI